VNDPGAALLAVFFILLTKHFVCDYPLQTAYQLQNKGTYGHPGGILHAGIHAVATTIAFLAITPTFVVGVGIVVGEFLVHYHIDWIKQQFMKREGWTTADNGFWVTLGLDQFAHHLTYVAIAAVLWATAT